MDDRGRNGTRRRVLERLFEADGWCSGEELSRELGVSRAAVGKHVRALRAAGYVIEAVTRRGYRLDRTTAPFEAAEVLRGLATEVFGRVGLHWHESTDSTNRDAVALAVGGACEGTVVMAAQQLAGRGRTGRPWVSPQGGVYVSLVLRPRLSPQAAPLVTLMTAVAAAEAVEAVTGLMPEVKWPNDLLMAGRKVCGNLTEVGLVADMVDWVVTGVGVNVSTPAEALVDAGVAATSLQTECGRPVARADVARAFLERAEHWYGALREGDTGAVITRWKELSDIVGRHLRVRHGDELVEGRVADMTPEGWLCILAGNGTLHRLHAGDVIDSRV